MNATGGPEVVVDGGTFLFAGPALAAGIPNIGGVFVLLTPGTYLVDVSMQAAAVGPPGAVFQIGAFQNGVLVPRATFSSLSNTVGTLGGPFIITTTVPAENIDIRNIIGSGAATAFDEERLTITRTGP